jgi:hypothetical protein
MSTVLQNSRQFVIHIGLWHRASQKLVKILPQGAPVASVLFASQCNIAVVGNVLLIVVVCV